MRRLIFTPFRKLGKKNSLRLINQNHELQLNAL